MAGMKAVDGPLFGRRAAAGVRSLLVFKIDQGQAFDNA
jgi:hypothetical protein